MNFLIVGLGSMGKRRIRCLQALGYNNLFGFDLRPDRRQEAQKKYGIRTFSDFDASLSEISPTALIISVPPHVHHEYMKKAIQSDIHFFVEASVVDTDMDVIKDMLDGKQILAAPSATLLFHPAIQKIAQIVQSDELGKISNVIFHSGQYLPDWHTYEAVSDYYVSNPATGGAREIVPFEMTWMTSLFGFPQRVCSNFRKTIEIEGAEQIDDTYNLLLDYNGFLATVTIDVVSRFAVRRLVINGNKKQLVWDWNDREIKIFNPNGNSWGKLPYEMKSSQAGYNVNIGENMYIDELKCFIDAVNGNGEYVNTIDNDHRVLKLLYAFEQADRTSQYVRFEA